MPLKINGFELKVQIHKAHSLVTTTANVANAETEILRVVPGENQVLIFPKDNFLGLKLYDTGGNEIAEGAELSFWRVDASGANQECFAKVEYTPWHNIAYSDQSKEQYRDMLGIAFVDKFSAADAIRISPGYRLEIRLKASTVVDWSNANTLIWLGLASELLR